MGLLTRANAQPAHRGLKGWSCIVQLPRMKPVAVKYPNYGVPPPPTSSRRCRGPALMDRAVLLLHRTRRLRSLGFITPKIARTEELSDFGVA